MRWTFVFVLACSSRTPHQHTPQPSADASIDAPVPDAATVVYGKCDWNKPDAKNPNCAPEHMPLMRCSDVNGPSERFPKCTDHGEVRELGKSVAKPIVLSIKRRGTPSDRGLPIVVDGGTNLGIDKTWRVNILDAKQLPLHGQASFVRLEPDEIEIVAPMTADEFDARAKSVRFVPP